MADALVERGAHGFGEAAVVERGGVRAGVDDHLVHLAVDVVGGDAGLDDGLGEVEDLRGEETGGAHLLDALGVVDLRALGHVREEAAVRVRGLGDAGRDVLLGGHLALGQARAALEVALVLGSGEVPEKLGETLLAGGDDEGARAAGRGVAGTARHRGGEGETAAREGGALAARAGDGGAREGTGGDPAGRGETRHVATDGGGGHVRGRSATGYAAAEPIESHLRPSTPTRWVTTTRRIVCARSARRAIPSGGEEAFLE